MRCQFCHNPDTWSMQTGTQMSADELLDKAWKYRSYWENPVELQSAEASRFCRSTFYWNCLRKQKKKESTQQSIQVEHLLQEKNRF